MSTEKQITMTALAGQVGMSRGGLSTAINNKTLTIETLEKIAEVLEVPVSVFFGEDQVSNNSEIIKLKKENESLLSALQSREFKLKTDEALIRTIHTRLKTSLSIYHDLIGKTKFKPGSPQQTVYLELGRLFQDTYNEIIGAISFNKTLYTDELHKDYLTDKLSEFMKSFTQIPGDEFNDKLNAALRKYISFIDENNADSDNSDAKT